VEGGGWRVEGGGWRVGFGSIVWRKKNPSIFHFISRNLGNKMKKHIKKKCPIP
jgi:hypothetical protein